MSTPAPELPVFVDSTRSGTTLDGDTVLVEAVTDTAPPGTVVLPEVVVDGVQGPPGVDGTQGPMGPSGLQVVHHGADPNVARPAGIPVVYWLGTAAPVNAVASDFWLKENI